MMKCIFGRKESPAAMLGKAISKLGLCLIVAIAMLNTPVAGASSKAGAQSGWPGAQVSLTKIASPTKTPQATYTPTLPAGVFRMYTDWLYRDEQRVGIKKIAWSKAIDDSAPDTGKIYFSIYIVAENQSSEEQLFNPSDFEIVDGNGKSNRGVISVEKDPFFKFCVTRPGGVCQGWWTTMIADTPEAKAKLDWLWSPAWLTPPMKTPILSEAFVPTAVSTSHIKASPLDKIDPNAITCPNLNLKSDQMSTVQWNNYSEGLQGQKISNWLMMVNDIGDYSSLADGYQVSLRAQGGCVVYWVIKDKAQALRLIKGQKLYISAKIESATIFFGLLIDLEKDSVHTSPY